MKKILLTLALSLSFTTVMAEPSQNFSALQKAPANSGIHKELNRDFDQCTQTCLNEFSSCIATAQGTGAWWYCELTFEKCEAECFANY